MRVRMLDRHSPASIWPNGRENVGRCSMQSSRCGYRKRELTFRRDALVLFGGALDAVARVAGITIRSRKEMTDLVAVWRQRAQDVRLKIDDLAYFEFMRHGFLTFAA